MKTGIVAEMQTYYARRAAIYDASMGYEDSEEVALLKPVIESLQRQLKDRTVLEVACGPGFWTRMVSETAAAITATDYNESMLAEARQKPLDSGRVKLLRADAYNLSASVVRDFDGVFAVDWLAHVPRSRMRDFLEGLHGTLKPHARVVFCDQLPGQKSQTGIHDVEGNHLQERVLPDGQRFQVVKHFLTDSELQKIFTLYAEEVHIERFTMCRRMVVGYTWNGR